MANYNQFIRKVNSTEIANLNISYPDVEFEDVIGEYMTPEAHPITGKPLYRRSCSIKPGSIYEGFNNIDDVYRDGFDRPDLDWRYTTGATNGEYARIVHFSMNTLNALSHSENSSYKITDDSELRVRLSADGYNLKVHVADSNANHGYGVWFHLVVEYCKTTDNPMI